MEQLTLRQIRLAREITLESMAKSLGKDPSTYSRWEEKPSQINIANCYKICELLKVPYDKKLFLP